MKLLAALALLATATLAFAFAFAIWLARLTRWIGFP